MDKMAQWKASILGINKTGHGGPSKGKHPTHAPMAKFAMGGKVVKKAEGGKLSDKSAMWYGTNPKTLSALQKNADSVRNSDDADSFKARIKKVSDVSISKPDAQDYGGTDAIEDVATAPAKIKISKPKAKAKKKEAPMTDEEIMAWNKKNNPNYAKGGKVKGLKMGSKKTQKHADEAQDKILFGKMMKAENKKEKMGFALKKGGKVKKKYADGGKVNSPEMQDKLREAEKESRRIMRNAQLKKDYMDAGKEDLWNEIEADSKKRSILNEPAKMKEKYAEGGSVRLQGDMKRPQFSANKSFDGGNTSVGLSGGKNGVRASISKKFAEGGAVEKLANEASGVINEMTRNRVPMKKGGKVKKAC